jgi:hypothetical protein
VASRGWFEKIKKKRSNIHRIHITGEAASVDVRTATEFPEQIRTIIKRGGYPPDLLLNIEETDLFWKHLSSKTFISQEERRVPGFKATKDL